MTHHGDPRRRPLRRERLQDLHHQRDQRRPGDHRGQDRPDAAPHGHEPAGARARHGGVRARAATWTRSASTPRTPPSCSSTTCACRSRTCSGRRRGRASPSSSRTCPRSGCRSRSRRWRRSRSVLEMTLAYVKERRAFGQPVGSFQNSRFVLAEIATELDVAQHYVDDCVRALNDDELTRRRRREGEVVDHRAAGPGGRPLPAAARRLRVHERVPGRAGVRRRSGHPHLRRARPRS